MVQYSFLLVGQGTKERWPEILQHALSSLGTLSSVSEQEIEQAFAQSNYDLVIVDAGAVRDVAELTVRLRAQQPNTRVIIATASPTWKRAREALKAGAVDYIRKSLDEKELCTKIKAVLKLPPSPR